MSGQQQHIIHSLRYEVHFKGSQIAGQQNVLSRIHREKALDLLQQVFDKATDSDRYVCIDTMELDLGVIPIEEWQSNLITQLEKSLHEKLDQLTTIQDTTHAFSGDLNKRGFEEVLIFSNEERAEDIFLFFLHHGYVKWNVAENHSLSMNTMFEEILSHKSASFDRHLKTLLAGSDTAIRRFVVQIHPQLQWQWLKRIENIAGESLKEISAFQEQLQKISGISRTIINDMFLWLKEKMICYVIQVDSKAFVTNEFLLQHSEDLIKIFGNKQIKIDEKLRSVLSEYPKNKILQRVISLLEVTTNTSIKTKKQDLKMDDTSLKEVGKSSKTKDLSIKKEDNRDLKSYDPTKEDAGKSSKTKDLSMKEDNEDSKSHDLLLKEVNKETKSDDGTLKKDSKGDAGIRENEELAKGVLAANAGLILLWPYLHTLFSEFQLMKEHHFKGPEEMTQALYVLHYLATGVHVAEEHELLIPKIITAYDLEIAVPSQMELKDSIYNECDHLLKTAIKQWSALKSTSPRGYRETFLQRHALIKLTDNGWQFMFERKGVDVLIDRLPYGLSVVRLKWLDNPIYVTW